MKTEGGSTKPGQLLFARTFGQDHLVLQNCENVIGKEFYRIFADDEKAEQFAIVLNSTFAISQRELIGSAGLGGGALKFSGSDVGSFLVPKQSLDFPTLEVEEFLSRPKLPIFRELGFSKLDLNAIDEEMPSPPKDRQAIDRVIFEYLGVASSETAEFYRMTARQVCLRVTKASSS